MSVQVVQKTIIQGYNTMKNETKFGEVEYSKRVDGKYAVYKYMSDPTASVPEAESSNFKDYASGRWVQIDVVAELPKSR